MGGASCRTTPGPRLPQLSADHDAKTKLGAAIVLNSQASRRGRGPPRAISKCRVDRQDVRRDAGGRDELKTAPDGCQDDQVRALSHGDGLRNRQCVFRVAVMHLEWGRSARAGHRDAPALAVFRQVHGVAVVHLGESSRPLGMPSL